jgi:hypothetical protein
LDCPAVITFWPMYFLTAFMDPFKETYSAIIAAVLIVFSPIGWGFLIESLIRAIKRRRKHRINSSL